MDIIRCIDGSIAERINLRVVLLSSSCDVNCLLDKNYTKKKLCDNDGGSLVSDD